MKRDYFEFYIDQEDYYHVRGKVKGQIQGSAGSKEGGIKVTLNKGKENKTHTNIPI